MSAMAKFGLPKDQANQLPLGPARVMVARPLPLLESRWRLTVVEATLAVEEPLNTWGGSEDSSLHRVVAVGHTVHSM